MIGIAAKQWSTLNLIDFLKTGIKVAFLAFNTFYFFDLFAKTHKNYTLIWQELKCLKFCNYCCHLTMRDDGDVI